MAIVIAKPSSFTKGENHTIKISRAEILAIPKVAGDSYFNNVSKWKSIEFHFYGNPENEIEVVKFKANVTQPSGIFSVSTKASNNFELGAITIHDFDGGMLVIDQPDFPNDPSLIFDIQFPVEIPVTPTLSSSAGVGTIVLTWTPQSQYNDYSIWKKTGSGAYVRIQNEYSQYSYTDTAIVGNETYKYYITQNWDDDLTLTSNEVTIVTVKPATPAITATYTPPTSDISVSWPAVTSAQKYFVYRSTTSNTFPESAKVAEILSGSPLTYEDTTPAPATTYYYAVRAIGNFASDLSPQVSITTVGAFNIAQFKATSQTAATISWTASANATAYKLFYRKVGAATWTEVDNLTMANSPRSLTGLTAGDYEAYIVSRNTQSTYTTATANAEIPVQPAIPTGVAATSWEDSKSTVTWSTVANADRYFIYRSGSQSGNYVKIGETTTLTFVNTGLSNTATYWYKIEAINDADDLSIPSGLSTAASGTPNIPSLSLFFNAAGSHPNYRFDANTNAPASLVAKFEIDYYNSAGVKQGSTHVSGAGVTTFQMPSFTLGNGVSVSAVAKLYTTGGALYTRAAFGVSQPLPATGVVATVVSNSYMNVSWTAPSGGPYNYSVIRSTSSSMAGYTSVANVTSLSVQDHNAPYDTNVYYAVHVFNSNWSGTPPAGFAYTGHSSFSSQLSNIAGPVMKIQPATTPKFWGFYYAEDPNVVVRQEIPEDNGGYLSPSPSPAPGQVRLRMIVKEPPSSVSNIKVYSSTTQNGTYTLTETITNPAMLPYSTDGRYCYVDKVYTGKTAGSSHYYYFEYTKTNGSVSPRSKKTGILVLGDPSSITPTFTRSGSNATASWPAIAGISSSSTFHTGYFPHISTSPNGTSATGVTYPGFNQFSNSLSVAGLQSGNTYYLKIEAHAGTWIEPDSNGWTTAYTPSYSRYFTTASVNYPATVTMYNFNINTVHPNELQLPSGYGYSWSEGCNLARLVDNDFTSVNTLRFMVGFQGVQFFIQTCVFSDIINWGGKPAQYRGTPLQPQTTYKLVLTIPEVSQDASVTGSNGNYNVLELYGVNNGVIDEGGTTGMATQAGGFSINEMNNYKVPGTTDQYYIYFKTLASPNETRYGLQLRRGNNTTGGAAFVKITNIKIETVV